jgi:hypothetical protein
VTDTPPVATITDPGWYRAVKGGWQRVPDDEAETEVAEGRGHDLVHADFARQEEQLW